MFRVHKNIHANSLQKRFDLAMDFFFTIKKLVDEHSIYMPPPHVNCEMAPNQYRLI